MQTISVTFRFGVVALCLVASNTASGCSCGPMPSVCEGVNTELVFTGTVLEVKIDGSFTNARTKVDVAYRGSLTPEVTLFSDGMCPPPELQVGRRYLIYGVWLSSGVVRPNGCSRTRAIDYADEDLKFLDEYAKGRTATQIGGSALNVSDGGVLADVAIVLKNGSHRYSRVTDSEGKYSVANIVPGTYEINAETPGYRVDSRFGNQVSVIAHGCAVANVYMAVDRRIEGIVRDDEGQPVKGVLVELVPVQPHPLDPWLQSVSDAQGHYAIDGIPPGDYYLGVNIRSSPTREHPFAAMYFPGTVDVKEAFPISIVDKAYTQRFDLRGPRRLPVITIRGRVLTAEGGPSKRYPSIRIKGPGLSGQIERGEIQIDSDGRFQYELCEGVRYSAYAFDGTPTERQMHSTPVEFLPTRGGPELLFILNKTDKEFANLTEALERK